MPLKIFFFVLSTLIAWALCHFFSQHLPNQWTPRTDIIGFPIHQSYNIDRVYLHYFIQLCLPFLSFLIFKFLCRCFIYSTHYSAPKTASAVPFRLEGTPLSRFIRVSLVAWALGTGVLLWLERSPANFLRLSLIAMFEISILHAICCSLYAKIRHRSAYVFSAALNIFCLLLSPWILYAASQSTAVLENGGNVVYFPWFNLPVALLFSLLALLALGLRFWHSRNRNLFQLESEGIYGILVPVLVFLYFSNLYGIVRNIDYYHDGTSLAPALLISKGAFPWRDVLIVRGLLEDFIKSFVGHYFFQESFWGALAGETVLLQPLFWVFSYFLNLILLRRAPFLLLVVTFILPLSLPQFFGHVGLRLMLQPLVLLLYLQYLRQSTWTYALAFTLLAMVQTLLSPEAGTLLVTCLLTLAGRDFFENSKLPFLRRFRYTLLPCLLSLSWGILWLAYLGLNHSLPGYGVYLESFSGFRFMTAIPLIVGGSTIQLAIQLPLLLIYCVTWIILFALTHKRRLSPEQYLMASLSLFLVFYYQKFLNRMDGHIYSVLVCALPLLYYLVLNFLEWVEGFSVRWVTLPRKILYAVFLIVFFNGNFSWKDHLQTLPSHFHTAVLGKSKWEKLGYYQPTPEEIIRLEDFQTLFSAYLSPEDPLFDFTNQPGLFYYVLGRRPATSHPLVYMALNRKTQHTFIQALVKAQPKLIIYYYNGNQQHWDGVPMMVRHYAISEYLLQHYQPLVSLNGYLILSRKDLPFKKPSELGLAFLGEHSTSELYFKTENCDWGLAPYFSRSPLPPKESGNARQIYQGDQSAQRIKLSRNKHPQIRTLEIAFEEVDEGTHLLTPSPTAQSKDPYGIRFQTKKGQKVIYSLPVTSCSQWYGYDNEELHLFHDSPSKIASIRFR